MIELLVNDSALEKVNIWCTSQGAQNINHIGFWWAKRIKELINTLSEDDSLKDQNDSKHGTYHERQTIRKSADFLHHALFFLRWLGPRDNNRQRELVLSPLTLTCSRSGRNPFFFFFFWEVIKRLTVLFSYKMGLKVNNNEFILTVPTVTALLDRFSMSITSHMWRILLR